MATVILAQQEKNMKSVISFGGLVGLLCLVLCPTIFSQSLQENFKAGVDALEQQRFADAEKSLTAALKQAEAGKPENISPELILYLLAGAYREQQKYTEAGQSFTRVLTIMDKTSEKNVRLTMGSYNSLGGVLLSQSKYAEAEQVLKKAVEFGEKHGESEPEQMYLALDGLALAFRVQNKYDEAELVYRREVIFCEKAFGSTDNHLAVALDHYAALLKILRRDTEAEKLEARAKAIRKK
jgi:tetratricopeptide (TPR) repeat protein